MQNTTEDKAEWSGVDGGDVGHPHLEFLVRILRGPEELY